MKNLVNVRKSFLLIFAILILNANISFGDVLTNEQIVSFAVKNAVEEEFAGVSYNSVQIQQKNSYISKPIMNGIIEAFKNIGVSVYVNSNNNSNSPLITYDIQGFSFRYLKGDSRGFLRNRMIKRNFNSHIKLIVEDARNGHIYEMKDIDINYSDQVDPKFADLIKSRNIPELSPNYPVSNFKRIVEPVVVTAAIGSLVYLFFANR